MVAVMLAPVAVSPAASASASASATIDDTFYIPLAHPVRVMDTRTDGTGRLNGGESRRLDLRAMDDAGRPGDSPRTRGSVVFNVTVTDASSAGYLTLYNDAGQRPTASNLNWVAGQTVSNLAFAGGGGGDRVSVFVSSGPVDLVIDASGFFPYDAGGANTSGTHYVPLPAPNRIYDSRDDDGPLGQGEARTLGLGVSSDSAINANFLAAAVTVTAVDETGPGYVTAWDGASDLPPTSTVNYQADRAQANTAIVPLACLKTATDPCTDLTMGFYNGGGPFTDLVVDVTGFFTLDPHSDYLAYLPAGSYRIGDSRTSLQNPSKLGAGTAATIDALVGSNTRAIHSAVVNVTAVEPTTLTYLSQSTQAPPSLSSFANPAPGLTTAAVAMPALADDGTFTLYNNAGAVDIVVDIEGIFVQNHCSNCAALARTSTALAHGKPTVVRAFTPTAAS